EADGADEADGATDGAVDPEAAGDAEPEAAGEVLGEALTAGASVAAGFFVRNPPWPPSRPKRRIPTKTTTLPITKYRDGLSVIWTARSDGVGARVAAAAAPARRRRPVGAA